MAKLNLLTIFMGLAAIIFFIFDQPIKWFFFIGWIILQGCGRSYGGYLEYKMSGDKSNFFSKVILPIIVMDVVLIVLMIVKLVQFI